MSGISSGTHFLIAGNKPGPDKLKKADTLGIPIITEDGFERMIQI
jgi:DNA ligase (NAD+)